MNAYVERVIAHYVYGVILTYSLKSVSTYHKKAKPSQAKPSQAKPRHEKNLTDRLWSELTQRSRYWKNFSALLLLGLLTTSPSLGEAYCYYNGWTYQCSGPNATEEQIYADMAKGDQNTYNYTYAEKQAREAADASQGQEIQSLGVQTADLDSRLKGLEKTQYNFETAIRLIRTKRFGTEAVASYSFSRRKMSSAGVRFTIDLTK